MQDAKVEVPTADYVWFQKLMAQNGWTFEWMDNTERPDFEEEDG